MTEPQQTPNTLRVSGNLNPWTGAGGCQLEFAHGFRFPKRVCSCPVPPSPGRGPGLLVAWLENWSKSFSLSKKFMSLKVSVMAPDRVFYTATVSEVILPTSTGQMGILTNHTPLITGLDIGVMLVREEKSSTSNSNEWISMALMGGFALIKENTVTILVNDAELASTIDRAQAEKAFQEAQVAFEKADGRKEKIETSLTFKRARARFQLVNK
jgi:ATP synthase F1 epsilon subunit